MKPTPAQYRALCLMIAEDAGPYSGGTLAIHQIPGRMIDSYTVARSLIGKGWVTRIRDNLYITDAGRAAVDNYPQVCR